MLQSNKWFCNAEGYADMTAYTAIRNIENGGGKTMNYKKGEIYYAEPRDGEASVGKPALIVSADDVNEGASTVSVLYLARTEREPAPTHVTIHPGGGTSIAFCEKVSTLSVARLGNYYATCSADDMALIEEGIRLALGLNSDKQDGANSAAETEIADANAAIESLRHDYEISKRNNEELIRQITQLQSCIGDSEGNAKRADILAEQLTVSKSQLDLMKKLYSDLLNKLVTPG